MDYPSWMWIGFNAAVLVLLALDLGVFHRKTHQVSIKEALAWSTFWIALSLALNYYIYTHIGHKQGLEFFAGYILEKSLSVDNLFVFLLIFGYFRVPAAYQHRVLFLGILGALIMRALFITLGVVLIHKMHFVLYIFGAFLIFSGIKMCFMDDDANPENVVVLWVKKRFPMTDEFHGSKFFVRIDGKLHATPLLLVLVAMETTDVLFAVDSVPAVLGVTQDAFIVYTSNIMAILGLRALYFALAGLMEYFHYLKYGLSLILVFIGVTMVFEKWIHLDITIELGIIGAILGISMLCSLFFKAPPEAAEAEPEGEPEVEEVTP